VNSFTSTARTAVHERTEGAGDLQTIGLSEKEIEASITVLRQESATMGTVAEAGNISQSYVYEIANRLAERDLLIIDESETPTMLRAAAI